MTRDIENLVAKCSVCNSFHRQLAAKPPLTHPVPDRPWQKVGVDLFSFKQKDYILVVDYYSKYPEISRLPDKTASTVIMHLKNIFARHGIPEKLSSDNMPFNSRKVHDFADEWRINLTT